MYVCIGGFMHIKTYVYIVSHMKYIQLCMYICVFGFLLNHPFMHGLCRRYQCNQVVKKKKEASRLLLPSATTKHQPPTFQLTNQPTNQSSSQLSIQPASQPVSPEAGCIYQPLWTTFHATKAVMEPNETYSTASSWSAWPGGRCTPSGATITLASPI